MHASVVEIALHSIGQANQKAVLSTVSMHVDHAIAREVWGHAFPRKIIKVEIESEDIFKNIYSYRDNFTLAIYRKVGKF